MPVQNPLLSTRRPDPPSDPLASVLSSQEALLLQVVAADTRGNVAAFNARGVEVWERHLASLVAQVHTIRCSKHVLCARPPSAGSHSICVGLRLPVIS